MASIAFGVARSVVTDMFMPKPAGVPPRTLTRHAPLAPHPFQITRQTSHAPPPSNLQGSLSSAPSSGPGSIPSQYKAASVQPVISFSSTKAPAAKGTVGYYRGGATGHT